MNTLKIYFYKSVKLKLLKFISLGRKSFKGTEKEWPVFPKETIRRDKNLLE
jgi:hypothetical protein